jgi:PAS domain S-box-containing protein
MAQQKAHILIVDDKAENIFALEQLLAKNDRQILSASNGKDALTIALNKRLDLIILDVQMPGLDGFEVAQILKSNKRTREIPILFASAEKKEHRFVLKGLEEGAFDYLYKPLDPDVTKAKVAVLLQYHQQKQELIEKNLALERYALLINNSADLICIINPQDLRFEEINEAAAPLLGYSTEELKGNSLLFYLTQEDRPLVKKLAGEDSEKFSFETRIYAKSRTLRWFQWNVVNKFGLWFANARDITAMKEVEEIKNYLATVVRQSDNAIYLNNPDGQIISWNKGAERIYGFSEAEALQMKIWNIVPSHLMEETQTCINDILKGKKIASLVTKRITKFGKIVDILFSASVITDAKGRLKSVAITERDITQQKKDEKAIQKLNADLQRNIAYLEATNEELESFSYSISHDLRSPLYILLRFFQVIDEHYWGQLDEKMQEMLKLMKDSTKRMDKMISALLAFSRLGSKEVVKAPIDCGQLVSSILAEFKTAGQDRAQVLVGPLPHMEGDPTLMYHVFTNLISNALKYSSKVSAPVVQVGYLDDQDDGVYFIKDNGVGFDMGKAEKMFGVFQRFHKEEDFEGTGVGLATVKRIVAKHGGKIWAEGKAGQGATFFFSLPKSGG